MTSATVVIIILSITNFFGWASAAYAIKRVLPTMEKYFAIKAFYQALIEIESALKDELTTNEYRGADVMRVISEKIRTYEQDKTFMKILRELDDGWKT